MSTTAARLRTFSLGVLAEAGAVVEWPEDEAVGEALLTPELASSLGCSEHLRISTGGSGVGGAGQATAGELRLDLAGDALERLQARCEAGPWMGASRLRERTPKRLDAAELVARSIDVANARVRLGSAQVMHGEYHCWQVAVQVAGEETWEDALAVTVHAASGLAVSWSPPPEHELVPWRPLTPAADTWPVASIAAAGRAEQRAGAFVKRLAARRERDRKRLREYYLALLEPGRRSKSSASAQPSLIEDRKRAVMLELARKLAEVDERSRLRCRLQPICLTRIELPMWALEVTIQRRAVVRTAHAYWNPLCGGLEAWACASCGARGMRFLARDSDAALLCPSCSG